MNRCNACTVEVRGTWSICPLCRAPLPAPPAAVAVNPLPDVPLRFDWKQVLRALVGVSVVVIGAALAALVLVPERLVWLRMTGLGLAALWLVVLIAVRKRRNVAKTIVYLVIAASLLSVYADQLTGWQAWSTTFVIPIICSASIVGLLIAVRIARMQPVDYLVYSWLTILMGVAPASFLAFGWVTHPLPSWISVAMGMLMLVWMQMFHGADVQHELRKRLHL